MIDFGAISTIVSQCGDLLITRRLGRMQPFVRGLLFGSATFPLALGDVPEKAQGAHDLAVQPTRTGVALDVDFRTILGLELCLDLFN